MPSGLLQSRFSIDAVWPRRSEFHVLTYAEEGFAPLNLHTEGLGFDGTILRSFADAVNSRDETGSLHPRAPVSAVPRRLIRDSRDVAALAHQIESFLEVNQASIRARRILFDFRTPTVALFVLLAVEQALAGRKSGLDEVVVLEDFQTARYWLAPDAPGAPGTSRPGASSS